MGVVEGQALPCLTELCLKGFVVTCATPARIAATCPNVHTLQLESCLVVGKDNDYFSSKRSTGSENGSVQCQPAASIHTLVLKNTSFPEPVASTNARVTRSKQPAYDAQQLLKSSLPNLATVHLLEVHRFFPSSLCVEPVTLWASQVTALHTPDTCIDWHVLQPGISQLQLLQKLVLPCSGVYGDSELWALLALKCLTHLELSSISDVSGDLSSHQCSWRRLRLHEWADLYSLSRVPLHSLQHPLELGYGPLAAPLVQLPVVEGKDDLAVLQKLGTQLLRCGVRVHGDAVSWEPEVWGADVSDTAAALAAIYPAFRPQKEVILQHMAVGNSVLKALAATHLRSLILKECELETMIMDHTTLTQLPSLHKLKLFYCYMKEEDICLSMANTCQHIMAAMAQQPAGRELEVWFVPGDGILPNNLLEKVLERTPHLQGVVNITTVKEAADFPAVFRCELVVTLLRTHQL